MITESINALNKNDLYSVLLFALYKIKDIPDFRVLSELIYILDKDSVLKLCEFFGGRSIEIPTIDDLQVLVYCLILFNDVKLEHKDFEQTLDSFQVDQEIRKKIRKNYSYIIDVLETYEFTSR